MYRCRTLKVRLIASDKKIIPCWGSDPANLAGVTIAGGATEVEITATSMTVCPRPNSGARAVTLNSNYLTIAGVSRSGNTQTFAFDGTGTPEHVPNGTSEMLAPQPPGGLRVIVP